MDKRFGLLGRKLGHSWSPRIHELLCGYPYGLYEVEPVELESFLGIFHNHNMVWSNGDAAHVISAMFTARIVSGEPRIDEESYELRFFGKEELPDVFAEDHIAALDAYFRGIRYPLLQENPCPGIGE